eukprot:2841905-Pleurochrysis_carterae.AAC.1
MDHIQRIAIDHIQQAQQASIHAQNVGCMGSCSQKGAQKHASAFTRSRDRACHYLVPYLHVARSAPHRLEGTKPSRNVTHKDCRSKLL